MLGRGLCAGTSLPYLPVNMDSHVPGRDEMTAANDAPQVCEEGPGQNNGLGGIPIFRGIDLPEAYRHQSYHAPTVSRETLQEWFSPARLSRYRIEPVDAWYVWNTRISKAFLEDISHVEVLLRNFIDVRLSADTGIRRWWESPSYRSVVSRVTSPGPRRDCGARGSMRPLIRSWRVCHWTTGAFCSPRAWKQPYGKLSLTYVTEVCLTTRGVADATSRKTWSSSATSVTAPPIKSPSSALTLTNKLRFAGLPTT